jgi:hypothetical protein
MLHMTTEMSAGCRPSTEAYDWLGILATWLGSTRKPVAVRVKQHAAVKVSETIETAIGRLLPEQRRNDARR